MNILHDMPAGEANAINVFIEIPKGSLNKYEIDKKTGIIVLDRVLHTGHQYPADYGFVPQTLWHDGDALDVVVLTTAPLFAGCLLKVRPVGIMYMVDAGEKDEKVIAVPVDDPRWTHVMDLKDVNPHTIKELQHFYETYKNLEGKEVSIAGFGDRAAAEKAFEESRELYISKK